MNIITRQDALYAGLTRYFTGEPCKNGHVSERYTKGSNCIACANPDNVSRKTRFSIQQEKLELIRRKNEIRTRELEWKEFTARRLAESHEIKVRREARVSAAANRRMEKRQALAEMQTINVHVADSNLALFKDILLALAQIRCAQLVLADLVSNRMPRPGQLYSFRCFGEHADTLREIQNALWAGENAQLVEELRTTAAVRIEDDERAEIDARWPATDPR